MSLLVNIVVGTFKNPPLFNELVGEYSSRYFQKSSFV